MPTIFTRIINQELPAKIFYETDVLLVIADHRPKDKVHLLIFPKTEYRNLIETPSDVLQQLFEVVKIIAKKLELEDHFRILINNGYGQEVDHIHLHFLSDRGPDKLTFLDD